MHAAALILLALLTVSLPLRAADWTQDFEKQAVPSRPRLEVRYTDASRTAFEILAQDYAFEGSLKAPHVLKETATGGPRLGLKIIAGATIYSTETHPQPSRINLYRRGPYFCEIHWLDLGFSDAEGKSSLPLRGDLALFAYPDKLLASLTLHATDAVPHGGVLYVTGRAATESFPLADMGEGEQVSFSFPIVGEAPPIPQDGLITIEATRDLRYDAVRGCYTIGSHNPGHFESHFYHHPNHYESVRFRVTNDTTPRTIYICHESASGSLGAVEGGVLLDQENHPLPITVQISKNFAGEKEEKFYNPEDTPFSETYFPLHLEPNETVELTSLHLYQNWGRHPVKQFSSLGAWMDYFHSSTGVTETTCYVPFKFGGLPGVAIADLRPMSQAFWSSQPQHDNIAGHQFVSYHDGTDWQHLVYRGTTYHSTGPNWMDIGFQFLSSDGKMRVDVRTFELPQIDELRNFVSVRCEALQPLTIENAPERLRLLGVTSRIQRLRYRHAAFSDGTEVPLEFEKDHFAVRGHPLTRSQSFAALHGEDKGSNAFVLRSWTHPSATPAASVHCHPKGDTMLSLTVAEDTLTLGTGDVLAFDAIFIPYGETTNAAPIYREIERYGTPDSTQVHELKHGTLVSHYPARIRATGKEAVTFTLTGGHHHEPLIITGLKDYRWPILERETASGWERVPHHRVTQRDGNQVFCAGDGSFGAVFLLFPHSAHSREHQRQRLRVRSGVEPPAIAPLPIRPSDSGSLVIGGEEILAGGENAWKESAGHSWWREWETPQGLYGARFTPNESTVSLEFWFRNRTEKHQQPRWSLSKAARTRWSKNGIEPAGDRLVFPPCPPGRRYHVYGEFILENLARP